MYRSSYQPRNTPCIDCGEREVGCHGKCESYKTWKADFDIKSAAVKKAQNIDTMLGAHLLQAQKNFKTQRGTKFGRK